MKKIFPECPVPEGDWNRAERGLDNGADGCGKNGVETVRTAAIFRRGKHSFFGIKFTLLLLLLILFYCSSSEASSPSYTFWYGVNPPVDLLSQFDRIIVEPDNIGDRDLIALRQHGGKVLAYLSIGEWNPVRKSKDSIDPAWVLGSNSHWSSQVMDLSSSGWRNFLRSRAEELKKRGFQGLFLDTLDSHMLPKMSVRKREDQQRGLVQIIETLKAGRNDFLLVANRGFEVMDRIAPYLNAVAAESLYQGWDNAKQQYTSVASDARHWLKQKLRTIQSKYKLDIVILDYLPPEQREKARETARRIEQEGFIPWIANPAFDYMGIGALETIPRKVLFLYDSGGRQQPLIQNNFHRFCAPIFEYMGYVPVYVDISQGLPREILKGRFVAAVVWLMAPSAQDQLSSWLEQKVKETIPIALLGNISYLRDRTLASVIGLRLGRELDVTQLTIASQSKLIGYEIDEPGRIDRVLPIISLKGSDNQSHLRIQDSSGRQADLVVTGNWGGLAADPAILDEDFKFTSSWFIDPFVFFQEALKLQPMPVPDITTENGRRLLMIHIDGDGFMEKFESPSKGYASEVLLEEIFKVYHLPHTISIIEGEVGPSGLYQEVSPKLESIAREIFALENVEIASHSYSHPFKWGKISETDQAGLYNLPIKGYAFDLEREIRGSVNYINARLAPPNKKTAVFLWTGNCLPTAEAMAMATDMGLLNMNGGDTFVRKYDDSLSKISGMGRPFPDGEFQVYAPVTNENLFTNNWEGPFFGYHEAIETFELTDSPRRFKPIDIYYHFYSGSKYASLKALKTVYDWALAQETTPVYASGYIRKVLNYQSIGIARKNDGSFRVTGLDELKTLRMNRNNGWPRLNKSRGIVGYRKLPGGIYIHVGTDSVAEFAIGRRPNRSLWLRQANGRIMKWQPNSAGGIDFRIRGQVPVLLEVSHPKKKCSVKWRQGIITPQSESRNFLTFTFPATDTGDAELICHE